ncbi:MmpS family transport accessory protein [Mycobacteroides salmoniphilum]|uniref:MmpS family transport accessory protein n=1 Tax=Mycobacteroides salmoniphilum TaxID=404941 RepID=UPI001F160220|nr:MmpS family transport accessory protein [Mycobacteroides salmoniphilum]
MLTRSALRRELCVYPLLVAVWIAAVTYVLTAKQVALPVLETPVEPARAALTLSTPKKVTYEVGTTAGHPVTVSYLDGGGQSRLYSGAAPWRTGLTTDDLAFAAGVTALSLADTVTCRIRVDGQVADEKSDSGANPSVSCNLLAFQKLTP